MAPANVNRPMDIALRDRSASEKLQLYGIYSAFSNGKLPSNRQVDVALNSALASRALAHPSDRLSDEGRRLIVHVRDVIEKAQRLVLTKNDGQLIQDFLWSSRSLSNDITSNASEKEKEIKGSGPITKDSSKQDGDKVIEGFKTLGRLIVTNGQFRKLLDDAVILARSIAGDAATSAAKRVTPSDDEMSQLDEFAEHNSWTEMPDFGTKNNANNGEKTDVRAWLKDRYQQQKAGKRQTQTSDMTDVTTPTTDSTAIADSLAGDASKTRAEWREKGKLYLDKKLPAERRDQTLARLKQMVVEIQHHADYQDAIVTLLDLADAYAGHSQHYAKSGHGSFMGVYQSKSAQEAEGRLKLLLERFANSTSLDDVIAAIKTIYDRTRKDGDLRAWFGRMNRYVRRCLQQPGFIVEQAATDEWQELSKQGDYLIRHRYRTEFDHVIHEIGAFMRQFDADVDNRAFAESVKGLFIALGQDHSGKMVFKPQLIQDLTSVIIPTIIETLTYVPLPRIEYRDPHFEMAIENVVIEADNIAPNRLEVKSDNHWKWGRKTVTSANKNKILVALSGIQMDMRDVSYYVRQKGRFPSFHDIGVLDLFIGGEGVSALIQLETADRFTGKPMTDGAHFFKATSVKVNAANMKINIRQSRHKTLLKIVKPILLKLLKPVIMKVVGMQIKKSIGKLDQTAFEVQQEVRRTAAAAPTVATHRPTETASAYKLYGDAIRARLEARKRQAATKKEQMEAAARQKGIVGPTSEFKLAFSHHDSLFPSVHLPEGITAKATEFRNLAGQGDRWESPVFGIGKAKPSAPMATASKPIRKSTWTPELSRAQKAAATGAGAAGVAAAASAGAASTAGFSGDRRDHHGLQTIPDRAENHQIPTDGKQFRTVGTGHHTPPSSQVLNFDSARPGSDYTSSKPDYDYVDENSIPMYRDQNIQQPTRTAPLSSASAVSNIPAAIDTRAAATDTGTGHKAGKHSNTSSMADTPMFPPHSAGGNNVSGNHHQHHQSTGVVPGQPTGSAFLHQNQQHNIIPSALPPSPSARENLTSRQNPTHNNNSNINIHDPSTGLPGGMPSSRPETPLISQPQHHQNQSSSTATTQIGSDHDKLYFQPQQQQHNYPIPDQPSNLNSTTRPFDHARV